MGLEPPPSFRCYPASTPEPNITAVTSEFELFRSSAHFQTQGDIEPTEGA